MIWRARDLSFSNMFFNIFQILTTSSLQDDVQAASAAEEKKSFFWRINSVPPTYMFGTIHVPYTRVWDTVPANAKMAFYVKTKKI